MKLRLVSTLYEIGKKIKYMYKSCEKWNWQLTSNQNLTNDLYARGQNIDLVHFRKTAFILKRMEKFRSDH